MMVLLNILVWVVLLGVAVGVVWGVWSVGVLVVAKRKVRWVWVGLPVSVLVVLVGVGGMVFVATRPGNIFEREFGMAVPGDTTVVSGSTWALGDSGEAELHFRTTRETFAKLAVGYRRVEGNKVPGVEFYESETRAEVGRFASEKRTMLFKPETGEVWFRFLGVD